MTVTQKFHTGAVSVDHRGSIKLELHMDDDHSAIIFDVMAGTNPALDEAVARLKEVAKAAAVNHMLGIIGVEPEIPDDLGSMATVSATCRICDRQLNGIPEGAESHEGWLILWTASGKVAKAYCPQHYATTPEVPGGE